MKFLPILLSMLVLGAPLAQSAQPAPGRPNLVFILADNLRWDALGCMGNEVVRTPNIDRLAARGVLFKNHFCTTSVSFVSRASIFTGQYERRHGIGDFFATFTPTQWSQTYPAQMRAAGYQLGFVGKFGVGKPESIESMRTNFDFWRGLPTQGGDWFIDPSDPLRKHATARFGDQALEFLLNSRPETPFCLSVSFNAPHARDGKLREFQPDPRDEGIYARELIPAPPALGEEFFRKLPPFVRNSEARRRWEPRFSLERLRQATMRDYYRLVTGIDREVGRIVDRLQQMGLASNTVVIFTGDNGWMAGDRGLSDQWFMYDESIRIPLVVFDPRLPEARRGNLVDAMSLNVDIAPTLLALLNLPVPFEMQGRSLLPLLTNPEAPANWRTEFFYEHHFNPEIIPPSEGIRSERWSYCHWLPPNPETEELYDLTADPLQAHNLAGDIDHADTLSDMRARWNSYRDLLK